MTNAKPQGAALSLVKGGHKSIGRSDDEPKFRRTDKGVERRIDHTDKETGAVTSEWRWFCSHLEIVAETRSSQGEDWGRLLQISDRDNRAKEWAMPMTMMAGDGQAYRERLLGLGLTMAPGRPAKDSLHEYIATAHPPEKVRCVGRVGWHGKIFVFPDETMEPDNA